MFGESKGGIQSRRGVGWGNSISYVLDQDKGGSDEEHENSISSSQFQSIERSFFGLISGIVFHDTSCKLQE